MTLVLACGCFEVLHPGHIAHLKAARELGTHLYVALTIDSQINKGPGRPLFTWHERANALRSLRCVSRVSENWGAVDSIERIRPDIYVKGIEYEDQEIPELDTCRKLNVRVMFLDTKPVYSSTRIMTGEMWRDRVKQS